MKKLLLLSSLLACLVCMESSAQSNLKLKPSKIQKLPKVEIEMADGKEIPRSWLYRVNRSDIHVVSKAYHNNSYDPVYFSGKILLEDIKSITIQTRQRRFKTNIIGAVLGGAVGYMIGRSVRSGEHKNEQLEILSQKTFSGVIEPIMGVIVGASIGIAIGDLFTPVTLDVNSNEKRASRMLREMTKKKRRR